MVYLEYVWLDGGYPQKLRSKTKIVNKDFDKYDLKSIKKDLLSGKKNKLVSDWNFDGSSTGQAETAKSELILKPSNIFVDPFRGGSFLIMCEVFNVDGSPHSTNRRSMLREILEHDDETNYGFEQEYFIYDAETDRPIGWPEKGFPRPQGDFYCAVGGNNICGREFVEEHATLCWEAGLEISGINFEVSLGQSEFQIGIVEALDGSDQLWIARYLLHRLSEKYGYRIELDPKPFRGNEINGSGMHCNFSTKEMRENVKDKKSIVIDACKMLQGRVSEHISVYGINNEHRLTGANETCSIHEYRYGIGDRTASIRIPSSINDAESPGYLEDRRPASNADPYEIARVMIESICCGTEISSEYVKG